MLRSDPRSWLDRLVSGCFALLIGAVALFIAVRLLESVWIEILIGFVVAAGMVITVAVIRRRSAGW